MTISDSQFEHWLLDPGRSFTVLAELTFAYQVAAGGSPTAYSVGTGTIYLADRAYVAEAEGSPLSTAIPYRDVIVSAPEFDRALALDQLGGRGVLSVGALTLNNADGELDFLLDVIVDGREIGFYIGDESWPRSDFRLVNSASVLSVRAASDSAITVNLRDKNVLLDATVVGTVITTGPNAGKPKPINIGKVFNFDIGPYLFDSANLKYYYNDSAYFNNSVLNDVRDNGVTLVGSGFSGTNATITANAGTDTISRTSHGLSVSDVVTLVGTTPFAGLTADTQYWVIAAGLTANDFRLSLTKAGSAVDITGTSFAGTMVVLQRRYYEDEAAGEITLSSTPAGRVTIDIQGVGSSGDAASAERPHAAMRLLLDNFTELTSADRNTSAFAALVTEESSGSLYWGRSIVDRVNLLDILDEIAVLTNAWYAWQADGLLSVGKLDLANLDGESAVETVAEDDIEGDPSCENLPLKFGKLLLDANRNVVVQADGLSSSVSAANKSLYGQPHQLRVVTTDPAGDAYLANWWLYHKSAIDSAPLATSLAQYATTPADYAQTVCDDRTELFKPWTRVFRCAVGLDKYGLNPGDCITVTYPRYGMYSGQKFRVMGVKTRISDRAIDLVLVRQNTPDYTTTSHV